MAMEEPYKDVFLVLSGGADSLSLSSLQSYFSQVKMNATEMECAMALKIFLDSDDLTCISVDEHTSNSNEGLLEEMKNVSVDYAKFAKLIDFYLHDEKIAEDISATAARVYGSDVKILVDALKKEKR